MDANSNTCTPLLSFKCSVDIIANTCLPAVVYYIFFYYLMIKKTLTITWGCLVLHNLNVYTVGVWGKGMAML